MKPKKLIYNRILFYGLILIVGLVTAMSIIYVYIVNKVMGNDTKRYLEEVSVQISNSIDNKVESIYSNLNSVALALSVNKANGGDIEAVYNYMKDAAAKYSFMHVSLVDNDYYAHSYGSSKRQLDKDEFEFLEQTRTGVNVMSGIKIHPAIDADSDGSEVVYYSVPVIDYKEGDEFFAVMCCAEKTLLESSLFNESFGGEGYATTINTEGDAELKPEHKNMNGSYNNFFEAVDMKKTVKAQAAVDRMKSDMQLKLSGNITYTRNDGERRVATYMPLPESDWYLLCIVPYDVTKKYSGSFEFMAVIFNVIMVLLFTGLILTIAAMQSRYRKRIERLAYIDSVTEGGNNVRFEIEVETLLSAAKGGDYLFVSFDVQNFKLLNDSFGAYEGDRTLRYIYNCIMNSLSDDELVTRYSGDNFLMIIRNGERKDINARFSAIADSINAFNEQLAEKYYLLTMFGVYQITDCNEPIINMRDRANIARKHSKNGIVSDVCRVGFYDDTEHKRLVKERLLYNRQDEALLKGQFVAYFQPKIDLHTRKICGAEALVRWIDPNDGEIEPSEFIPYFENNGFILKVDLCIFEQALILQKQLLEKGYDLLPISINLSRLHLYTPDFLQPFLVIMDRYDADPSAIEFEITESLLLDDMQRLLKVVNELHDKGFKVSLDDFGSGYSSLNVIMDIPVDTLKMDKEFFRNDHRVEVRTDAVVKSVIDLAKRLNTRIVAEGVETQEQVSFLQKLGCDCVQGFVFSRPLPSNDFIEFLKNNR